MAKSGEVEWQWLSNGDVSWVQKAALQLYRRNVPLFQMSRYVIAYDRFYLDFPHISTASDKHWRKKARRHGYEATCRVKPLPLTSWFALTAASDVDFCLSSCSACTVSVEGSPALATWSWCPVAACCEVAAVPGCLPRAACACERCQSCYRRGRERQRERRERYLKMNPIKKEVVNYHFLLFLPTYLALNLQAFKPQNS